MIAFSTAAFLAAQGTSASVDRSINDWFNVYDIDAFVWFQQPVGQGFATTLHSIPDVTGVDAWANTGATIDDTRTVLWGIPAGHGAVSAINCSSGRWYGARR